MPEPKRTNRKSTRTYDAPIEPAYHLRLVPQKAARPAEDQNSEPLETGPSLPVNPPESGLLSRLIERISKL